MSEEIQKEKVLMVFIGYRFDTKHKPTPYWIQVTKEQFASGECSDKSVLSYEDPKDVVKRMGVVGGVYEIEQKVGTSSIFCATARYQGLWPNQEDRTKWQVEDRLTTTQADLEKEEKKDKAEDHFAALRPFREKYGKLISHNQKAALLAQMIAFVTAR